MRKYLKFSLALLLAVTALIAIIFARYTSIIKRHEILDASSKILNPQHVYLIEHEGNAAMPQAIQLSDANGKISNKTIPVHYANQPKTPWQRIGTKECDTIWITNRSKITFDGLVPELSKIVSIRLVKIHSEHALAKQLDQLRTKFPSIKFEASSIVQP